MYAIHTHMSTFITITTMEQACGYCGYEWMARKEEPVSCPRCKRRFDYPELSEE
jgi:rubrerythrin